MKKNQKNIFEYLGLPGSISLLSLGAGWISIVLLIEKLPFLAIVAAITAFLFDSLDGYVARKTKKESEFGRQLDGLFDLINYSLFSSLLFWLYVSHNIFGILVGFFILATGALRLIRFNVEGFIEKKGTLYYSGIIVCHVALTAIVIFLIQQVYPLITFFLAIPSMVFISILQVTRIPVKKTGTYTFWFAVAIILLAISVYLQLWHPVYR